MKTRQTNTGRLIAAFVAVIVVFLHAWPASAQATAEPGSFVPDIAMVVSGLSDEAADIEIVGRLAGVDGVLRASFDGQIEDSTTFYLALEDTTNRERSLDGVIADSREAIEAVNPQAKIMVGGSAVVDAALADRYRSSLAVLVVFGGLLGIAAGLVFGWRRGIASSVVMMMAIAFSGVIGGQVSGGFDGTLGSTPIPGALAGLVVGAAVCLRVLLWFRAPLGTDGADTIRRSILEQAPELALVLAGVTISALVVWLFSSGRSPLLSIAVAAIIAAIVVLAALPTALTAMIDVPTAVSPQRERLLPVATPDGRDLPLAILAGLIGAMVLISLFALQAPGRDGLDHRDLSTDVEAAAVAEQLMSSGGDPTAALVAIAPAEASQPDFDGWAELVAERPEVAWVDTGSGRVFGSGLVEGPDEAVLLPAGQRSIALIVPAVTARSEAGHELDSRLTKISLAGGSPTITGESVQARELAGSRTIVFVSLLALALAAAVASFALTQSYVFAAASFGLRLLSGAATVGVFSLMAPGASMAETLTVVGVLALGLGLFELEFARTLLGDGEPLGPLDGFGYDEANQSAGRRLWPNPGQVAGIALLSLAVTALAMAVASLFGGGPGLGVLGLGLAVAVSVEFLIGLMVLRPALLGQRTAFHTAVRPVRVALNSRDGRRLSSEQLPEDPAWRRIVTDLLQTEFRFQTEPDQADLSQVFVTDTPLYRQATGHHQSMAGANLRIVGRSPKLRSVRTVNRRLPTTLAVTVDHPGRHLIDAEGTVIGVRKAERRSGVLWLSPEPGGSYRIAESVELGVVPLTTDEDGGDDENAIDLNDLSSSAPSEPNGQAAPLAR